VRPTNGFSNWPVDGYFFGNDFGTQRPDLRLKQFDRFICPGFVNLPSRATGTATSYPAFRGSIYRVIPRLIEAG
jgi:hypothetical protein